MSSELLALAITIGVPLVLRLLDYLLPEDRHFKFVHKYSVKDRKRRRDDD